MCKAERIVRFVHKIARKQNITYDEALDLKIVQEYIKYVEQDTEITAD